MRINFFGFFHTHDYHLIKWRFIHRDNSYAPASRVYRLKCRKCGQEKDYHPKKPRDREWEYQMRELQGYWTED